MVSLSYTRTVHTYTNGAAIEMPLVQEALRPVLHHTFKQWIIEGKALLQQQPPVVLSH